DSLTLMFQKEVAERIVAQVASKAYGRLSLLAQWRAEAKIVMHLPPSAFTPPPKVSSAIVHLKAFKKPRFEADAKTLERTVAKAFNQRRKMLRSSLKGIAPNLEDKLQAAGISPKERAEKVSLEQFCALSQLL
ncbi:MAG: rRNA adenine dimethyltransferase family protein, partial [Pseudomonadota bacterium]|nr:rRNA adenine dimethyltransferase family protein [Pseudomonadota bacterium]